MLLQPVLLMVVLLLPASGNTQQVLPSGKLRILWYNVENLFHPSDDSLATDDPFTPEGSQHWDDYRYQKKLTSLARVIVAAGGWEPPEVVGMCEVEERRVVEELAAHPILEPYGYRVVHREGPDHRGTEVACLYREKRVKVSSWKAIPSVLARHGERTRNLLSLELTAGRDTLHLLLCHLISKYRGEGITAELRREQAEQLAGLADSLRRIHPGRLVVVAGDFNDPPGAYAMTPLRGSTEMAGASAILEEVVPVGGPGTYKYQGQWSHIDRFLVSRGGEDFLLQARIVSLPALLVTDEAWGGMKPFRTYQGPIYLGGTSDHLPVVLEISRR